MAETALLDPLASFTTLSPQTYFSTPTAPESPSSPSLILILSWLDARPRHLRIYLSHYQAQHPHSPIAVVMTSKRELLLHTVSWQRKRLEPILDLLLKHTSPSPAPASSRRTNTPSSTGPDRRRVMIHAFSNAGAIQLSLLAQMHRKTTGRPLPLNHSLTVLDSAPGLPGLRRSIAALSFGLPKNVILRFIVRMIIVFGLTFWTVLSRMSRLIGLGEDAIRKARRVLNEPDFVDMGRVRGVGKGGSGRRLYLYGKGDVMVGWEDVESHIAEAKSRGWKADGVSFERSGHVAHVKGDERRYWEAVEGAWEHVALVGDSDTGS